jgi:Ca2+-binding RTX toxin-like protein
MKQGSRSLGWVAGSALLVAGALAAPDAKADEATCAYDAVTHVLAVRITPSNDFAPSLNVIQGGQIVISDGDDGSDCGPATVTNTDTIAISSTSDTQTFGPFHVHEPELFVPGLTNETGSSDEIEFVVDMGTQGGDVHFDFHASASPVTVAAGGNQINLNAAESDGIDADVTVMGSKGIIEFLDTEFADLIDAGGGGAGVPANPFLRRTFFEGYVLDAGADVFIGGARDDVVFGMGGDDHLEGGSGEDQMQGFGGDDVMLGGPGKDLIEGSQGADTLSGGGAADVVFGQAGPDLVHGNGGSDHVVGGALADRLFGDAGADLLQGQGGNDALNGGPDDDVCQGGAGADTFAACETQDP